MGIKEIKKSSDKRQEFKLPSQSSESTQFNLESQKSSLLKYNENMRTAKDIRFSNNGRLKIPVFSADEAICEVGEIAYIGGIMKVCSAANTWTAI